MSGRDSRARTIRIWLIRQAKQRFQTDGVIPRCGECTGALDLDLSGRHPDGPALDHRLALHDGGDELDLDNCRLVHTRCNSRKENRRRAERRREAAPKPTASRVW